MKKNLCTRRQILLIGLLGSCSAAFGSAFQSFTGISYSNPAELPFLVKNTQVILGDVWAMPDLTFNGTVFVPPPLPLPVLKPVVSSGASSVVENFSMPYGRIAQRITDGLVADVDITEPFKKDIVYGTDSAVRYSATVSRADSVDIAPNLAYQFSGPLKDLSIGAGLDALRLYIELDEEYPSLPQLIPGRPPKIVQFGAGDDLNVSEKASAWAYGWHAGVVYHAFVGTFLGASYFSAITPDTMGKSTLTGFATSDALTATINLPATTNLSLTQFITPAWSTRLQVHYTQWSRLKEAVLENVAGPLNEVIIPTNYRDTWRVDLGAHYDATSRVTLGALVAVDETPTNNVDRTVRLPEGEDLVMGGSLGYKLTKALTIEGNYAHVFTMNKVPIDNTTPQSHITTIGDAFVSGNAVGLKLIYNT